MLRSTHRNGWARGEVPPVGVEPTLTRILSPRPLGQLGYGGPLTRVARDRTAPAPERGSVGVMTTVSVSAIGVDRPGIVSRVTGVLAERGCNLEDTSMTILRGHFAMTLVVDAGGPPDELAAALAPIAVELGLVVDVRELSPAPVVESGGRPHVVAVHGVDHPGIVHAIANVLAEHDVNITDLTTRLVGGDEPLYVMTLDVDIPTGCDPDTVAADLRRTADELGVTATMHAADAELL